MCGGGAAAGRVLGPATLNMGTIAGGRAPNVVADEARAEICFDGRRSGDVARGSG